MSVRIVTDSTCDLPAGITTGLGIQVIPLHIHIGNRDFLDGIDISRQEFYANLPNFPDYPTTAGPSPSKFRAVYDSLAGEGANEILSIHLSETLSAVMNIARTAAAQTTSVPVTVLDSRQLSMGTGFLVQTAAELAGAGMAVHEILPYLNDQIRRTHVWAALSNLHSLRRSGRMNKVVSTIGEILQIKPVLKMHDGISAVEKFRTQRRALDRLVEILRSLGSFEKIAFLHSNAMDATHRLMKEVQELLPDGEIMLETINPVLGAHIGSGVVGFACVVNK